MHLSTYPFLNQISHRVRIFVMKFPSVTRIGAGLLLLCIGGFGGWAFERYLRPPTVISEPANLNIVRLTHTNYKFIAPILGYELSAERPDSKYQTLQDSLNQFIAAQKSSGAVESVSVSFRDFPTGQTIGINDTDTYTPASLLKVPIMIAYYKEAGNDTSLLTKKILVQDSDTHYSDQDIPPDHSIEAGKEYTVEELIRYMIAYSDNNAMHVLFEHVDPTSLVEIFKDLGIDPPQVDEQFVISPKTYALFFRLLRNNSLLSADMSERALQMLSESTFADGLAGGVPTGTVISHKFGEARVTRDGHAAGIELHDCGIIYAPQDPYLLCVMTKGTDKAALEKTIQHISKIVFQQTLSQ